MNTNSQPKGTAYFRSSPYTNIRMDTSSTGAPFTYWLKREQRKTNTESDKVKRNNQAAARKLSKIEAAVTTSQIQGRKTTTKHRAGTDQLQTDPKHPKAAIQRTNRIKGTQTTTQQKITLWQTGSIPALVLPSGGVAARHRKGAIAERN
ncbi:hypothetical protein T265_10759 [Opisthorchis viverrini]|uniref:Uncharacterized protein n=1 Tax=Opisthorchis viverrini TaxID=6198 RepID=A0A074ZC31_OPIVI|nr:hypothetical protein T265_10759 [Opisthorchis viverrini]KER20760.1 hypothetical protein T265_10759 [Opisthorchis viverrini]